MGYETRCRTCWGKGFTWRITKSKGFRRVKCRHCGATGHGKRYRKMLTIAEAATQGLGYDTIADEPWPQKQGRCSTCAGPLSRCRRRFCSRECSKIYLYNWWKAAHWQKRLIVARDGPGCCCCHKVFTCRDTRGHKDWPDFTSLELDHRVPLGAGGTEHADNCQIPCGACHKAKTKRERG